MNARSILILSLAANIALAALLIRAFAFSKTVGLNPSIAQSTAGKTLHSHILSNSSTPPAPGFHRIDGSLWSQFDSDDLITLARRLREAGFPYRAVRQIIWDLNSARGEIARAAIQGKSADTPYWKNTPYYPDDPAKREKIREINQQINQVYMKLMADPDGITDDNDFGSYLKERFGELPVSKLQQAAKITTDYWQIRNAITAAARKANPDGELTPADKEKLALLTVEEERDLQQAMTPEEYTEYQYRSSPTASRLRDYLELFHPTEQEYKTIFALQQSVDAKFKISAYEREPQDKQAYQTAMKTLDPQIKAALGDERYAEYLQAMDQSNNKLKRLVSRLDLPLTTVGKILDVQSDLSQRAETIQHDQTISPSERATRTAQLVQEAQSRLTSIIGQRGFEAYEENKGSWLRSLREKATETTP